MAVRVVLHRRLELSVPKNNVYGSVRFFLLAGRVSLPRAMVLDGDQSKKKIKGRRRGGLFAERGVHTSGLAASQWYVRDASEHGTVRAT
jgi:hypothetical protein